MSNWKKIYAAPMAYEVEVLKQKLEEHDIPAIIMNKRDSAYPTFGEVELYTQQEFVVRALNIIKGTSNE